ncbi:MAG: uroporphyrinogen-III synthase [Candidatus Sericytochromatia bacterium]|nr:uroporphyrinogen-III synthase [Candidatus Sericytochromatia bacterium]
MSLPVLVTGDGDRATRWVPDFAAAGLDLSVITVRRPVSCLSPEAVASFLGKQHHGTWLVLGSAAALPERAGLLQSWPGRVLAVGEATAAAARRAGARDVVCPSGGGGMETALGHVPWRPGDRVLWLRGTEVARDLRALLEPRGIRVTALETYRMVRLPEAAKAIDQWIERCRGRSAWWVATSPLTVRTVLALCPWPWQDVRIVALGKHTEAGLIEAGLPVAAVADRPTAAAVRDAIVKRC